MPTSAPRFPVTGGRSPVQLLRWMPLSLLFAVPVRVLRLRARRAALAARPAGAAGLLLRPRRLGAGRLRGDPGHRALRRGSSLVAAGAVLLGVAALARATPCGPRVRVLAAVAGLAGRLRGAGGTACSRCGTRWGRCCGIRGERHPGARRVGPDRAHRGVADRRRPIRRPMMFPSLIGRNRAFLARFRKLITQNNYAFTYAVDYDGRPIAARHRRDDLCRRLPGRPVATAARGGHRRGGRVRRPHRPRLRGLRSHGRRDQLGYRRNPPTHLP